MMNEILDVSISKIKNRRRIPGRPRNNRYVKGSGQWQDADKGKGIKGFKSLYWDLRKYAPQVVRGNF